MERTDDEEEQQSLLPPTAAVRSDTTDSMLNDTAAADPFTDLTPDERKTFIKTRNVLVTTAIVLLVAIGVGVLVAVLVNKPDPGMAVTLADVVNCTLCAKRQSIRWVAQDGQDGISTYRLENDIYVWKPPFTDSDRVLIVNGSTVIDPATGEPLDFYNYWISPDQAYVLYATNYVKVWRHSFNATYYVFNVANNELTLLAEQNEPVQLAEWAPNSASIAYVTNNNLYIYTVATGSRITVAADGSIDILNGIPSWVYEEEVFGTNSALWWAPDGMSLVYMKSNESMVPIFTYPIYGTAAYPTQVQVKYPKSGEPNPSIQMIVYSIGNGEGVVTFDFSDERYVVDVAWASTSSFLLRVVPRVQNTSSLYVVDTTDLSNLNAQVLSTQQRPNGWIDYAQLLPIQSQYYLDIVDVGGYNQLALYPLQGENTENYIRVLTGMNSSQSYEVLAIAGYNSALETAYYFTTQEGPQERHLYSVKVFDENALPQRMDYDGEGYYTASFSMEANYYLLSYDGPAIPYQQLLSVPGVTTQVNVTVEDNAALKQTLELYDTPKFRYFNVTLNDITFNAVMIVPSRFDEANKGHYPVLVRVYGGPASQLVLKRYTVDWHTYLASSLGYVVVQMDARGTSGRGNEFKNIVYKNLGYYEAIDQLAMGQYMKSQSYVDSSRVFVWGWSYGGYLTSKILEIDAENVFTGGIAVAPVTSWLYYDSIYTERYMLEPNDNQLGYDQSAVAKFDNFMNKQYLLVHGTEDDNVHYQHSAVLISKMVAAGVPFEMFAYTDEDHSINTGPNTTVDLYSRLTRFLQK